MIVVWIFVAGFAWGCYKLMRRKVVPAAKKRRVGVTLLLSENDARLFYSLAKSKQQSTDRYASQIISDAMAKKL
jgi:hypothetical protein